jgi:hypothetical protein
MGDALRLPFIAELKRTKRLALDGSPYHVKRLPSGLNAIWKGVRAMSMDLHSVGFVMYSRK